MKKNLQKLAKILNSDFGDPFCPKGLVSAIYNEEDKTLEITIGPREVIINEDFEVEAAGTMLR